MSEPYRVLDLFSGLGGFTLGLERTGGFKTVAFCEIEPFCRRVLAKHWPEVPCYDDVRALSAYDLHTDGIAVDVICGGFPCQDISTAGKRAGIEGERSGLWAEYARLVGELRPNFVIVDNVAALLFRGMGRVLGDLAALGYDAEWHGIPASALGARHIRDRMWIVAYPNRGRSHEQQERVTWGEGEADAGRNGSLGYVAHADAHHELGRRSALQVGWGWRAAAVAADGFAAGDEWRVEPDVGRVAHGVPDRLERLGALGNAVVPQIPELIGRAILAAEGRVAA